MDAAFAMDAMIRTHLERGEPLLDLLVERDSWLGGAAADVYNYLLDTGVLDYLTPLESYERVLAGLELIAGAEEGAVTEEEEEEAEEDEFDFQDRLDYEEYLEYLHQYD